MRIASLWALVCLASLPGCSCRDYGTGARAYIAADPASLDFGTLVEGTNSTLTLTLQNDGRARLSILSMAIAPDPRGAYELLDTVTQLEAGELRNVRVRYQAPTGDGVDGSFLVIESTADNTPTLQVGLVGRSASSCVPESDAELCFRSGKNCGPHTAKDNCGILRTASSCGSCTPPATCGAVAPGVCGCIPESDGALCLRLGKNCGAIIAVDNCGASRSVASCGNCQGSDVCGATTLNVCGCVPETNTAFCARLGKNCDPVTAADNCGATRSGVNCGSCSPPQWCGALQTNVCGCAPATDAQLCATAGKNCGTISVVDNCNQVRPSVACGTCASNETCHAYSPNVCACIPETASAFCSRLGKNCGPWTADDNCGTPRTVPSCGPACTSPQTCGAVIQGVCGCVQESDAAFCSRLGKNCGSLTGTDNCGFSRTVTSCGTCTPPANATPVCGSGVCDFVCINSTHRCGNSCCGDVAVLGAGWARTCAVDTFGSTFCWGAGPVGDGTSTAASLPRAITALAGSSDVSCGAAHCCAVKNGGAYCWGGNTTGQLGDGTTTTRLVPTPVSGLGSGVARVTAGGSHTCAMTTAGAVLCWGANPQGQLGDGTATGKSAPVNVLGLSAGVTSIVAGTAHTCAVVQGGAVWCWGDNADGALGDGTTTSRGVPGPVSGLDAGVVGVTAGGGFSCAALGPPGTALCWGRNTNGMLGDGTASNSTVPVPVTGLSRVTLISAGTFHACAVTDGGVAYCWGANYVGQLGDGTTSGRTVPGPVLGLDAGANAIEVGDEQTCVRTTNGTAHCWGGNGSGQLGNGGTANQTLPGPVLGL